MLIRKKKRDLYWYVDWTRWFAWYPVRLNNEYLVWLETVERKDTRPYTRDDFVWEYRRVREYA